MHRDRRYYWLILALFSAFLLTTGAVYAGYAQCTDGLDNDMDGLTDANDPGCASGTEEFNAPPAPAPVSGLVAGGLLWLPVPTVGSNIVANPGFEQLSSGKPLNWTLTAWNALDSSTAHSGVNSLRSAGPAGGNSASQSVYVRPGFYRVSAWAKAQNLSGAPSLVLGFWPWTHARDGISIPSGAYDWTYIEKGSVVVSGNSSYTGSVEKFGLVGLPSGTFWVDDVELRRELIPIEVFMLYPNYHGYLFDDQNQTLKFDITTDPLSGQSSDYRVDAIITTESGAIVLSRSFPGQAHFVATLDGSSLSAGQTYLARFKLVRISDNAALYEYPAYRMSKVSGSARSQMAISYDENNRILIKGQPSFLLGVYDSHTQYFFGVSGWEDYLTNLRKLFEMPINVYNNYWMNSVPTPQLADAVSALYKNGIYYLHTGNCVGSGWGMPSFPIYTDDAYLTTVSSWPGTIGFYMMDECDHNLAPEVFKKYQRLIAFKPDGITFGSTYSVGSLHVWRDNIDLLSTDPYPIGDANAKITRAADWTLATGEAVKNSRPIATVPQLLKIHGVFPNYEQLRSMSYMAIVEGANGLIYWSVGAGAGPALGAVCTGWCDEKTMYFSWFKNVLMELKNLEPALISVDRPDLLLANSNPAIHSRVKFADGKGYIIAYNYKDTAETTTFTWNQPPLHVFVYNESREISAAERTFSDTFKPYEAHVYVVSTSTSEPPLVLEGSPGGWLPYGTPQATLQVTTDKAAVCRYANQSGLNYDLMPGLLSTTDGTHHSIQLTGLASRVYKFYVRCASGTYKNTGDYLILFVVDKPAPVISNVSAAVYSSGVFVSWNTNEKTDGQAEFGPTSSYGNSSMLNSVMTTSHTAGLSYIPPGVPYHYRIKSRNVGGELAVSDDMIITAQPVPFTPIRVNVGSGATSYKDKLSQNWVQEVGYIGGTNYWYYVSVDGTEDDTLYSVWRYSTSPFYYKFNIPNGNYTVRLKFAEMYNTAPGANIFNVEANGNTVISNLDIAAVAGLRNALDRTFNVYVSQNQLELRFVPVKGQAKVNAIEILEGTSAPDAIPPSVSLTYPVNNSKVNGTVVITAAAADNEGVWFVEFYRDGSLLSADYSSPYQHTWNTNSETNGIHALMARAADTSGNFNNSAILIVNVSNAGVDTIPPFISSISAVPGRTTAVITWTTSEPSNSSVGYGTTVSLGMTTSDPSMSTAHSISLSGLSENMLHYYSVKSCDASGNCNTSAIRNFTATSSPDTVPPTVLIISPSDGVNVNGLVAITANASDNIGVSYVEFWRDGALLGTDDSSPYSYAWDTSSETNGQHTLMARAVDASGDPATDTITVNVNNSQPSGPSGPSGPPGPIFPTPPDKSPPTTPANLAAKPVSSSKINLSWSASTDNIGMIGYKIYRNGVQIATSKNNSYTDMGLSPGTTYTYTVLAYDASDNPSSQSSSVSVTTLASESPSATGGETEENGKPFQSGEGKNVTKEIGLFETLTSTAYRYPMQYAAFFAVFVAVILSLFMLYRRRHKKRDIKEDGTPSERPVEERPEHPGDLPRFF